MSYQSEIIDDSPTVYLELEEASGLTADDDSGNSLDGTYAGSGVTYRATGPLIPEDTYGVTLNGTAGTVSVSLSGSNRPTYPFCLEAWVKPSSAGQSDVVVQVSASDGSEIAAIRVGEAPFAYAGNWVGSISTVGDSSVLDSSTAPGTAWVHLFARFVSSTERYFYIDGSVVDSSTDDDGTWSGSLTADYTLQVGSNLGINDFIAATVSRVAYYNADVSASRIETHYNLAAYDEPVTEKIALRVKARMATITEANGYRFDATAAREDYLAANSPSDKLLVVHEEEETRDEPEVYGSATWRKGLSVACYATEQDTSITNLRTRANRMASDVYKAVATDYFWDDGTGTSTNLALNTFIRPPTMAPADEGGVYCVLANFDIQYRTNEDDPYTSAM